MKKESTIYFSVHPTPMKPGETQQTYHVRHRQSHVMHSDELSAHIANYTMISEGMFKMMMETLRKELAEQLLSGKGVHLDGIGRFSLQLGTVKEKDEHGKWRTKTYTDPKQLTAREVTIEGITFVPDKAMMQELDVKSQHFQRDKRGFVQEVTRGDLLKTLSEYCQQHGSFTRRAFQFMFGVSRYKADRMLNELVNEAYPKYYREKLGTGWVYRKTGT